MEESKPKLVIRQETEAELKNRFSGVDEPCSATRTATGWRANDRNRHALLRTQLPKRRDEAVRIFVPRQRAYLPERLAKAFGIPVRAINRSRLMLTSSQPRGHRSWF